MKMGLADSMKCAQNGINGMYLGRAVVIDGLLNSVIAQSYRIMPRAAMRIIVGTLNAAGKD